MRIAPPPSHAALGHALAAITHARILKSRETCWASASFSGARHRFVLELKAGHDIDSISGIGEREFALPGHIVADIALVGREIDGSEQRLTIEALTVEDS